MEYKGYEIRRGHGNWNWSVYDEDRHVFSGRTIEQCKAWIDLGILGNW